ncbi:hypothetical protein GJ744_010383 [Endocarpon pusillum]|uniref:Uncharacterized protein n=1 Tax=Endocarpon pusillum TaxID=364733 RepID=A0A8H7AGH7_9EURO|nr:hypothetical protein GJ744_010383 [Endocarpon pusillum]
MERFPLPDFPPVTSPVPSYRSNVSDSEQIPLWSQQVAAYWQGRQHASRASSIISTRTKLSTNTATEDARSIDINIDPYHFRINRDGSRITTSELQDTLPKYGPPVQVGGINAGAIESTHMQNSHDERSVSTEVPDYESGQPRNLLSMRPHLPNTPDDVSNTQNSGFRAATDTSLTRNPSYTPGKDTISVTKRRAVSEDHIHKPSAIARKPLNLSSPLRRRNGVRLPTLLTNMMNEQQSEVGRDQDPVVALRSPNCRLPRSAEPRLGNDNHSFLSIPSSPMFIGRNAPGSFPSPPPAPDATQPPSTPDDQRTVTANSPARIEEGYADTYPPPPMDSENDVSVHYTRLIRTIDRDHRKALHERDKDIIALRERLHEQDTVYRQELRGRDFIVDDLKNRIAHLESTTEARVEQACNSIEDLWENRWKDRDFHLMERMRRMEIDLHTAVERAILERDQTWAKWWTMKYKQLVERLEQTGQLSQHDLKTLHTNPPNL